MPCLMPSLERRVHVPRTALSSSRPRAWVLHVHAACCLARGVICSASHRPLPVASRNMDDRFQVSLHGWFLRTFRRTQWGAVLMGSPEYPTCPSCSPCAPWKPRICFKKILHLWCAVSPHRDKYNCYTSALKSLLAAPGAVTGCHFLVSFLFPQGGGLAGLRTLHEACRATSGARSRFIYLHTALGSVPPLIFFVPGERIPMTLCHFLNFAFCTDDVVLTMRFFSTPPCSHLSTQLFGPLSYVSVLTCLDRLV